MRFSGFSGEWEKIRVSDLLDFFPTNSLSWEQLDLNNDGLLNLHYGLIHNGLPTQVSLKESNLPSVKTDFNPRNYTLCKDGDVAFADASEDTNDVGKTIEFIDCNNKEVICGLHTIHGRDKLGKTITGYKGYAFSSPVFHNQIRRLAQGTKVFSLSTSNFKEVTIGIPGKAEQQKISSLLYHIDQRIAIQSKVIEDLLALKESITSKLLQSHEGERKNLGDITEIFSNRNKGRIQYPMYSVTNDNGFILQTEQFEDREMTGEDISAYKIIEKGDIAYNPARINVGSIAKYDGEDKCMISSLYVCIRAKKGINANWLIHILKSRQMIFKYNLFAEGGVRLYLFYPNFSRIQLYVPSYNRQAQIAKALDLLEAKILVEGTIFNSLICQKNYFLTQLFV